MMTIIDYYHRLRKDGSYETICTRCFSTVGRAPELAELKQIEEAHSCSAQSNGLKIESSSGNQAREPAEFPRPVDRVWRLQGKADVANTLLLLFSIVVCFYVLPTVIEFEMMKYVGVWGSCIVFGDLLGCSFLSMALGLRKTGVLLYGFLAGCEGWLYAVRIVRPELLLWLVDLVPTLAILSLVLFFPFKSRSGGTIAAA
jgi:hypothetical protein